MRKTIFLFTILATLICTQSFAGKPKLVGQLNMISTRNIDSGENYVLLKRGTNDSKKAFKQTKAKTIDGAIQNAVADVPGGEFMKNVKLYSDGSNYSVIGDVWGISENADIEGFKVGDVVFMKNTLLKISTGGKKFLKVTITGLKGRNSCLVKFDNGTIKEVDYSKLSKTGE